MHNGSKLKSLVEKSGIKVQKLIDESGVSKGSLYNFYGYEEIGRKKVKPLLDVLGISVEDFFSDHNNLNERQAPYTLQEKIKDLEEQVTQLKKLVANQEDLIQMLKAKSETATSPKKSGASK